MDISSSSSLQNCEVTKGEETLRYLQGLLSTLPLFQRLHDDLEVIEYQAQRYQNFDDILILGTGGSSLGGQALTALRQTSSPRLHFLDNIDASTFDHALKKISLARTGVIAISKSGNTAETLMQLLTCFHFWKGLDLTQHFLIVSEPGNNAIRELAAALYLPTLDHPHDVGGRFSVFTVVGMLPSFIAGVDGREVRVGALEVLSGLSQATVGNCSPLIAAMMQESLQKQGVNQSVFFTYCDRLQKLACWYSQLWAESLGKKDSNGQSHGTTPLQATGATDQHSQLQLYLEGPRNKFFTVLTLSQQHVLPKVEASSYHHPALLSLHDKTMGDLMIAEQRATIDTLRLNNCPVRELAIKNLTPKNMGALMMNFILETLAMAHLLKVNPFDQPAVEGGKHLALKYLESL